MRRALLCLCAAVLLLPACDEPPRQEPAATGRAERPTEPGPPIARWRAPSDYDFVVRSRCGEQTLIGTFRISVRDGMVEGARGLDESAATALNYMSRGEVPTLEDLVELARAAREGGADVAEVSYAEGDGHPRRIELDYNVGAIDDESCFEISRYRPRSRRAIRT